MGFSGFGVIIVLLYFAISALILYFVIKFAVKKAIREFKEDDIF